MCAALGPLLSTACYLPYYPAAAQHAQPARLSRDVHESGQDLLAAADGRLADDVCASAAASALALYFSLCRFHPAFARSQHEASEPNPMARPRYQSPRRQTLLPGQRVRFASPNRFSGHQWLTSKNIYEKGQSARTRLSTPVQVRRHLPPLPRASLHVPYSPPSVHTSCRVQPYRPGDSARFSSRPRETLGFQVTGHQSEQW